MAVTVRVRTFAMVLATVLAMVFIKTVSRMATCWVLVTVVVTKAAIVLVMVWSGAELMCVVVTVLVSRGTEKIDTMARVVVTVTVAARPSLLYPLEARIARVNFLPPKICSLPLSVTIRDSRNVL